MKRAVIAAAALVLLAGCAGHKTLCMPVMDSEAAYAEAFCQDYNNGRLEARLPDGTRADCLTRTHAVEVDRADHWYEGLGQALHYAGQSGLRPGLVLIEREGTERDIARAKFTARRAGVRVWVISPCP